MKLIFLQTLIGLLLSVSGIQAIYMYISGLDKGTSILLLFLALFLIFIGLYFLMRAGKSDASVFTKIKNFSIYKLGSGNDLSHALEKNNQLTQEWSKTIEKRDKLKMLEISTAATSEASEFER